MTARRRVAPVALFLALLAAAGPVRGGHGPGPPPAIAPDHLRRLQDAGDPVVVVDLRPAEAFRQRRVRGARSLPLAELPRRLAEIPASTRVVLYGASPEEAAWAYEALRERGYRLTLVLEGGLPAWVRLGLPVDPPR